MTTDEEWRPIAGYEGRYEVSNLGRVRSLPRRDSTGTGRRGIIRRQHRHVSGYVKVGLCRDGWLTNHLSHRVVAAAFLGPCPPGYHVNHRDGVKNNNAASNLEYLTPSANRQHAVTVLGKCRGTKHALAKLTDEQVHALRAAPTGATISDLARRMGVSRRAVRNAKTGRSWAHLTPPPPRG